MALILLENKHYKKALTDKFALRNKPCRLENNKQDLYRRAPLRDPSNTVRLLYVFPKSCSVESDGAHLIRCELLTHRIDKVPRFVALSYAWGNPSTTHKIVIGRQIIQITETLANALQQMQHPWKTLKVWADALCINQADEAEKGQQVQMMGKIYMKACLVYASLGLGDDDSSEAIRKIRFYNRVYDRMREKENHNKGSVTGTFFNTSLEKMRHHYSIEPIRSFLGRPWFSRIWVFQEAVLNKHLIFGCGSKSLSRDELFKGTILWHSAGIRLGWPDMPLKTLRIGCYGDLPKTLKDFARSSDFATFSIANGGLYQCTDPRDYVYGLLGLISDHATHGLQPDYSKTKHQVFEDFSVALISVGEFSLLQQLWTFPGDSSLPSWVPNFEWTRSINRRAWVNGQLGKLMAKKCLCQKIIACPSGNALSLHAVELGVVTKIEESLDVNANLDHGITQVAETREYLSKLHSALQATQDSVSEGFDKIGYQLPLAHCPLSGYKAHENLLHGEGELWNSYQALMNPSELNVLQSRRYSDLVRSSGLRHFFHTNTGHIGLSQGPVQTGDLLYYLCGTDCRWVLRNHDEGMFKMVSAAVIYPEHSTQFKNKDTIVLC